MTTKPTVPLRGEAAWKAAKKEISDRNEAAYARGRRDRAAKNADAQAQRRAADREANQSLPDQPGR